MQREFRDIDGWPGYRVSNDGIVESCRTNKDAIKGPWRPIKIRLTRDGYHQVRLWNCQASKMIRVHTLVLKMFVGQPPDGQQALHGPRGKSCNHIDNLRWGTAKENAKDRDINGAPCLGVKNPHAKLTEAEVLQIRQLRKNGKSLSQLAKEFGVQHSAVRRVCNRETWRHVLDGTPCGVEVKE